MLSAIKDFVKGFTPTVSNILTKNNSTLKKEDSVENTKKDIEEFISTIKFEDFVEKTSEIIFPSKNVSVDLSCVWSASSFKCCHSDEPIGTSKS